MTVPRTRFPLIDVHAHYVTDSYLAAAFEAGHQKPDGMPGWPQFSVSDELGMMDREGIGRAVLSISSPGVHFGDDRSARRLAAEVNDFGAKVVAEHPDRFGLFASLPLPDLEGALAEATRALDDLGALGVIIETTAGGHYVSDPVFAPLLDELDRRGAVMMIHPTSPACSPRLASEPPPPMLEFLFESTRTVADLILTGVLEGHPDLQVVIPHGGAMLPLVADRIEQFRSLLGHGAAHGPSVRELLSTLWYDMAGTPFPVQIPALAQIVGVDHLLYGSDSTFTPESVIERQIRSIDEAETHPDQPGWRELTTTNAERLFQSAESSTRTPVSRWP
jgi:predicted TIM-barrel fold metal-dependent hydrolase